MSLAVGQTAYYTRYALTVGIQALKVSAIYDGGRLDLSGACFSSVEGADVFGTLEEAQEAARAMARRKLKLLEKQQRKLVAISVEGAKVAT